MFICVPFNDLLYKKVGNQMETLIVRPFFSKTKKQSRSPQRANGLDNAGLNFSLTTSKIKTFRFSQERIKSYLIQQYKASLIG
jgi:hypothetical protein